MIPKKFLFFLLLIPLFFIQQATAASTCQDSYCNSCLSNWSVYGDYLYWRTRRDNLDYAIPYSREIQFQNRVQGEVFNIEPSYNSGFRVGLGYECSDCWLWDIFYTHFHTKAQDSVNGTGSLGDLAGTRIFYGTNVGTLVGVIQFAKGDFCIDYDTVDILVGSKINCCSCLQPYFFSGLKLVFIDQTLTTFVSETPLPVTAEFDQTSQKINLDSYGIDMGIGGAFDIWSCLNLFGRLSLDALIGNVQRNYIYESRADDPETPLIEAVNLTNNSWLLIGAINLAIGLNYNYQFNCCWCGNLGLYLGYEFHQYLGIPDFLYVLTDQDSAAATPALDRAKQSLGFDGLFARISLGF